MPAAGRKPKEGDKRNRMPPVHEWRQIERRPFTGKPLVTLPAKRSVSTKDGSVELPLLPATKAWWRAVSRMPHCSLWSETDWQFAMVTALVADAAFRGDLKAVSELRQRERVIGTTDDARRDLRIRYVDPEPRPPRERKRAADGQVVQLDDRRARVSSSAT
jgi:hypothetical protein